ncbi:MAG: hypothetical protein IJJ99_01545 [Oscillospiraceae bacterium]|nr:hypothetical protein [Oscillospiraceae bacterium]
MSNQRQSFEKKELALSASPYVYLPMDIPTYVVEITHRDEINGELLQQAVNRTLTRMPYLADSFTVEKAAVWYAKNPLPMEVGHTASLRRVGGPETNYHMLDVTWDGNITWFSMFHGFCDGQGVNAFIESVLYHYYCRKDGVEYEANGVRTDKEVMSDAETFEPLSKAYEVSPDFQMPERREQPKPYHLPDIVATPGGEVQEYGFSIPSEAFMGFVKANGTSPVVALSMLMGEAILKKHPDADAPIFANIPVSIRRMLGCEETFKNCSSRAVLPLTGTPMDALPFAARAGALRGVLKQQMAPDLFRSIYNRIGQMYRQRMMEGNDYWEELRKPAGFMTVCHDTFYTDYIGRLHETEYSDQMTDVRFLCSPAAGNTLHINMIEHHRRFRIDCLACSDVTPLMDALEEAFRAYDLPAQRIGEQCFTLALTAWREGM